MQISWYKRIPIWLYVFLASLLVLLVVTALAMLADELRPLEEPLPPDPIIVQQDHLSSGQKRLPVKTKELHVLPLSSRQGFPAPPRAIKSPPHQLSPIKAYR